MVHDRRKLDKGSGRSLWQFSLRELLGLTCIVAFCLALVTQLHASGFVIAAYTVAVAYGCWRRNPTIAIGGLTAIVVFVMTYFAAWVELGYTHTMDRNHVWAAHDCKTVHEALEKHHSEQGNYPEHLTELNGEEFAVTALGENRYSVSIAVLYYDRTDMGVALGWLGRDGKVGGEGLDADRRYNPETQIFSSERLSLEQFLFHSEGGSSTFVPALLSSLAVAMIWWNSDVRQLMDTKWLIIGTAATTILAVAVAVFLAGFYIAASQSGH